MHCSGGGLIDPRPAQHGPSNTDAACWPRSNASRGWPTGFRSVVEPQISSVANVRRPPGTHGGQRWWRRWCAPPPGLLPCCSGGDQASVMANHRRGGFGELQRRFCWLRHRFLWLRGAHPRPTEGVLSIVNPAFFNAM